MTPFLAVMNTVILISQVFELYCAVRMIADVAFMPLLNSHASVVRINDKSEGERVTSIRF